MTRDVLVVGSARHGEVWRVDSGYICVYEPDGRIRSAAVRAAGWCFPGRTDQQLFYYVSLWDPEGGEPPWFVVKEAAMIAWQLGGWPP